MYFGICAVISGLCGALGLAHLVHKTGVRARLRKRRPTLRERIQLPAEHEDILTMSLRQVEFEINRLEQVYRSKDTPADEQNRAYLRAFWLQRAWSMTIHR